MKTFRERAADLHMCRTCGQLNAFSPNCPICGAPVIPQPEYQVGNISAFSVLWPVIALSVGIIALFAVVLGVWGAA